MPNPNFFDADRNFIMVIKKLIEAIILEKTREREAYYEAHGVDDVISCTGNNQPHNNQVGVLLKELIKDKKKNEESYGTENGKFLRRLMVYHLKKYGGEGDPTVLEDELRQLKNLLNVIHCPTKWRVDFAVYLLEGEADAWWSTVRERSRELDFGWAQFKEIMKSRYYPERAKLGRVPRPEVGCHNGGGVRDSIHNLVAVHALILSQ
ncbi:hypothetical protein Drorol1_Dr00012245 [Drosera rotundifolia]